jgi:hypothetical protein
VGKWVNIFKLLKINIIIFYLCGFLYGFMWFFIWVLFFYSSKCGF